MLENAIVVKVAKAHAIAATREMTRDGWMLYRADMSVDPAILTVYRDPSLPRWVADRAERMRKRVEFVYGDDEQVERV